MSELNDCDIECCKLCKNYYVECDSCNKSLCYKCDIVLLDQKFCNVVECSYCAEGYCYNNITLNIYCIDCCPSKILANIAIKFL